MEKKFKDLLSKIKKYNPKADFAKIKKAFGFAAKAHEEQKRLSGDPLISHPLAVADVLASWKLDTDSIVAGLLHDVVEDGGKTTSQVEKNFGERIAVLVDGVTKIGDIKLRGRKEEEFVENLRRMIVVMAHDLRVVLIKLADRYHNMQTLSFLSKEKQVRIARETLEIYAPLAERLGMGEMKGILEDLSFPYCYPEEYKWAREYSEPYYYQAEEYIHKAIGEIKKSLEKEGIKAEVHGRAKHLYSLWQKLLRAEIDKDITKVYDLMAARLITDSVGNCYATLGIVHRLWKPVPAKGISDFIAQPKPNGYRSIHTRVFGVEGKIMEIQIRTQAMHEQAENGIASHWYYTEQKKRGRTDRELSSGVFAPSEKLSWVRQLVAWQGQIVDSREFLEALKFDALHHRIFVFSPKGDVFDLPQDATPVDFAYAVHGELGDKTIGAKVDGRMVSLDEKLKSGQMVEILTDKRRKGPSSDWLSFVVTTNAKRRIRRDLKKRTK